MKGVEGRILIDTNVLIYAAVARVKIRSIASLPELQVLPLTADVQAIALELCEKYRITKQRYFDAQIAATMVAHGIRTLITENDRDFAAISEIRAVNPFTARRPPGAAL